MTYITGFTVVQGILVCFIYPWIVGLIHWHWGNYTSYVYVLACQFNMKCHLHNVGISSMKIRWSHNHLVFIMKISTWNDSHYTETAPRYVNCVSQTQPIWIYSEIPHAEKLYIESGTVQKRSQTYCTNFITVLCLCVTETTIAISTQITTNALRATLLLYVPKILIMKCIIFKL